MKLSRATMASLASAVVSLAVAGCSTAGSDAGTAAAVRASMQKQKPGQAPVSSQQIDQAKQRSGGAGSYPGR